MHQRGQIILTRVISSQVRASDLVRTLNDMRRLFTTLFKAFSDSVPHIYLSLLLMQDESEIARHYCRGILIPAVRFTEAGVIHRARLSLLQVLTASAWLNCFVTSPTHSAYLAYGTSRGEIAVLNVESRSRVHVSPAKHDQEVRSIAFFPDGMRIVSGSEDGIVRVWDIAEGTSKVIVRCESAVLSVAVSQDGSMVACGDHTGVVRAFTLVTGEAVDIAEAPHSAGAAVEAVKFRPRSPSEEVQCTWVASVHRDGLVQMWNVTSGEVRKLAQLGDSEEYTSDLVFTHDGIHLICGSGMGPIFILHSESGAVVRTLWPGGEEYMNSLSISPSGEFLLAICGRRSMHFFDLRTSQAATSDRPVTCPTSTSGRGNSAWSNDNFYIATRGATESRILLYDATVVNSCWIAGHASASAAEAEIRTVIDAVPVIARDKSSIVTARNGVVMIWKKDARGQWTGHRTWKTGFSKSGIEMAISHDRRALVIASAHEGRALIWTVEAEDQQPVAFDIPEFAKVMQVAFPPVDGSSWFAMVIKYSGIQIRKADTGVLLRTFGVDGDKRTLCMAISSDASRLASGYSSGKVRVWDIQTGTVMHTLAADCPVQVTFLPNAKMAAYTIGECQVSGVTTWNLADESSLSRPLLHGSNSYSRSPIISTMHPVSDCFAGVYRTYSGQVIQLQNTTTGQWLPGAKRHFSSPVHSLGFSSDGEWLLVSFHNGVVKIWDPTNMHVETPVLQADGWLVGAAGELLMWVPEHLRRDLEWDDDAVLGTLGVQDPVRLVTAGLREDEWLAFDRVSQSIQ